ncbi:MAG: 4Fe-4S binding protein [Deltaproteobacteria bacterium]|nr:4Fe-4S binding protein [Deltaproteobacteria bacterium]
MKIMVDKELCIGCGICSEMCPEDVLEIDEDEEVCKVVNPDDCVECKACEVNCEYGAIKCLEE